MWVNNKLSVAFVAIGDLPTGGPIGTAPATVDIAVNFKMTQGTAGQNLSLPNPTNTESDTLALVHSVPGGASFTMHGANVLPGTVQPFIFTNGAWRAWTAVLSRSVRGAFNAGIPTGAVTVTDDVVIAAPGAVLTMPNPTLVKGKTITIKKDRDAGTVTINAGGGGIDGLGQQILDQPYGSVTFVSDGTQWMSDDPFWLRGILNTGTQQTAGGINAGRSNTGADQSAWGFEAGQGNTGSSQTVGGYRAGFGNTGNFMTGWGWAAGIFNTGLEATSVGYSAGSNNSGDRLTSAGTFAGFRNTGADASAFGSGSGQYNSGQGFSGIGFQAGAANGGTFLTALGWFAGDGQGGDDNTFLGAQATTSPSAVTAVTVTLPDIVNFTAHGIPVGKTSRMFFNAGTVPAPYSLGGGPKMIAINANQLQIVAPQTAFATVGAGLTGFVRRVFNRTTAIGRSAVTDEDDTFMLGTSVTAKIKTFGDFDVLHSPRGLCQRSPNGNRWRLQISNAGAVTAVLAP